MPLNKMKIGILQCGRIPEELIGQHDDYNIMFEKLLGSEQFEYRHWAVLDNVIPSSATEADGWLITGSRFGVYEDHDWIPPLEQHIKAAYAAGIPLVGICFGHQIIAQALGGTVVKFDGGWSVGQVDYTLEADADGNATTVGVHAFHQDQITRLPEDAQVFGSSAFCQYAFVRYKGPAMSIQPHPEFTNFYLSDLLKTRGKVLPPHIVEAARQSIGKPLARQSITNDIRQFFLDNRKATAKEIPETKT